MKKLVLVLVLLFAATALFAQAADVLSSLPSGSWLDHNFNGTWTFSASGISIRDNATGQVTTFNLSNMENLRAVRSGLMPGVGFSNASVGKSFSFYPNLADGTMNLSIERAGQATYTVVMQKQ